MTESPSFATTDLCDAHPEIQVCDPVFQPFGGALRFSGPITTLKVFEDNTLVKQAVESLFKVKVVDVKTAIVRGKMRRIGRSQGMRPNWKKAIITLKEGDAISIFEGK